MSFGQAVSSGFSNYATFSGRSSRSAYWWWVLFNIIVSTAAIIVDSLLGFGIADQSFGWLSFLVAIVLIIPSIAVTFRRLHDTSRSGWWWLLALVCGIGGIILFIFCLLDSTPGDNQYGPNPKAV